MNQNTSRNLILLADLAWIVVSLLAASRLRFGTLSSSVPGAGPKDIAAMALLCASSWTLLFIIMRLDGFIWGRGLSEVGTRITFGVVVLIMLVSATAYLFRELFSRLALGLFAVFALAGFVTGRWLMRSFLSSSYFSGRLCRAVIIGDGRTARELARKFQQHPELRCRVVGFFSPDRREDVSGSAGRTISTLDVPAFLRDHQFTDVILALEGTASRELATMVSRCREANIRISLVPSQYELYTSRSRMVELDGVPLLTLTDHRPGRLSQDFKAATEYLAGAMGLVVLSPVLAMSALYVWRRRGKAFRCELRCGRHGALFSMYRLNVLREGNDLSPLESILCTSGVTELPQLWNVIRGEMSIVGPRPEPPDRVKHYSEWHRKRLAVKPGITGLAQVHGLRDHDPSEEKTRFDLQYILNWSPLLDLSLLLQTIWILGERILVRRLKSGTQQSLSAPVSLGKTNVNLT